MNKKNLILGGILVVLIIFAYSYQAISGEDAREISEGNSTHKHNFKLLSSDTREIYNYQLSEKYPVEIQTEILYGCKCGAFRTSTLNDFIRHLIREDKKRKEK